MLTIQFPGCVGSCILVFCALSAFCWCCVASWTWLRRYKQRKRKTWASINLRRAAPSTLRHHHQQTAEDPRPNQLIKTKRLLVHRWRVCPHRSFISRNTKEISTFLTADKLQFFDTLAYRLACEGNRGVKNQDGRLSLECPRAPRLTNLSYAANQLATLQKWSEDMLCVSWNDLEEWASRAVVWPCLSLTMCT